MFAVGFSFGLVAIVLFRRLPDLIPALYLSTSIAAFIAYGIDKSAALIAGASRKTICIYARTAWRLAWRAGGATRVPAQIGQGLVSNAVLGHGRAQLPRPRLVADALGQRGAAIVAQRAPLIMIELITVATITVLAVISPGADFAMVTRNSMVLSRRAGVLTAVGIALGVLIHVAYSMAGIGLLISRSILLFSLIKFAGAAYLIYLGVTMMRAKKVDPSEAQPEPAALSDFDALKTGFFANALNPKASSPSVLAIHAGHQSADAAAGPVGLRRLHVARPSRVVRARRLHLLVRGRPARRRLVPASRRARHRRRAGRARFEPGTGVDQAELRRVWRQADGSTAPVA